MGTWVTNVEMAIHYTGNEQLSERMIDAESHIFQYWSGGYR